MLNETFEGAWPSSGWSVMDLSNDEYHRKWGSDDYRLHPPSLKAAWPARSGRNGRNPTSKNNDYFNTMDTRMIYGPFDLSDASTLEINFWMWWQTEANQDYLIVEVSGDNQTFTELGRWQGTSSRWQLIDVSTNDYALDGSVWVAWRFTSNASNVFDGPWVDDILLSKNLSQFVNVRGTLSYYNRYDNLAGAAYTTAYLYDHDFGGDGDDLLRTVYTEANGSFDFGQVYNIDDDDPNDPIDQLDLYVVWKTFYNDSDIAHHQVENFDDQIYQWQSNVFYNISDPTININKTIPTEDLGLGAMWIFQDLHNAWEYVYYSTIPQIDPGSVTAKWVYNENCYLLDNWICNSFFFGVAPYPFLFIQDERVISSDVVVHEIGHAYMYNTSGWWWPWPDCWYHEPWIVKGASCAWSEGWADFFTLVENNDQCFDWGIGSCGSYGYEFYDLEIPSWDILPWGDTVQGHVSGSLYDLYDDNNDGYDSSFYYFSPIAGIVFDETSEGSLQEFWDNWMMHYFWWDHHNPVRSLYQNSIDYDQEPSIFPPDKTVFRDSPPLYHAIDFRAYSYDPESFVENLLYNITYIGDLNCGIALDDHWINIAPVPGWTGTCIVVAKVSDSIKPNSNVFAVRVIDGRSFFLPVIVR